jgi:hypothetical protein
VPPATVLPLTPLLHLREAWAYAGPVRARPDDGGEMSPIEQMYAYAGRVMRETRNQAESPRL